MKNPDEKSVVVIGAGVGGLCAAVRLASAGLRVTVIEAQAGPGGKMRTMDSRAGPVDAGPTVLTMRGVFDEVFACAGTRLEDHVTLVAQPVLARHWWPDGSTLDLFADPEASAAAIADLAGARAADEFRQFHRLSAQLYTAFDAPMMQAARPHLMAIAANALRNPRLWPVLRPGVTLARHLARQFSDPRLRQLFGRYATYVGGAPDLSPAVLSLIWAAEAQGVWAVQGGMHGLAQALARLAQQQGASLNYNVTAGRIERQEGRVSGVKLSDGRLLKCNQVVFNGDPAALLAGLLGKGPQGAVRPQAALPRSQSAWVWAFAAQPMGVDLAYHNVFFCDDPVQEFGPIAKGQMPDQATLYVCAQDRAAGPPPLGTVERFEIIMNAPPDTKQRAGEIAQCRQRTFPQLARFGLTFDQGPPDSSLTTPQGFATLFPGSQGALYGRSPVGMLAPFQRPGARTALQGLYLAGGGAHPGAGVPMAALSGKHAAEAILSDLALASKSHPTAMPGGTSTGFRTTGRAQSR